MASSAPSLYTSSPLRCNSIGKHMVSRCVSLFLILLADPSANFLLLHKYLHWKCRDSKLEKDKYTTNCSNRSTNKHCNKTLISDVITEICNIKYWMIFLIFSLCFCWRKSLTDEKFIGGQLSSELYIRTDFMRKFNAVISFHVFSLSMMFLLAKTELAYSQENTRSEGGRGTF